jgi:hypothetical protein
MVEQRIGAVAYKLTLPAEARIHPVVHVSQLKPFTAKYSPVFSELPRHPDLVSIELSPSAILERRMVKKGNEALVQLRVTWGMLWEEAATWEDADVLRRSFLSAPIWEGAVAQGEGNVTPIDPSVPIV